MTGSDKQKGRKSAAAGKPLRSRGFLSHPGGIPTAENGATDPQDIGKPNRSRGQRQPVVRQDRKPENLATRTSIRPYKLEDK